MTLLNDMSKSLSTKYIYKWKWTISFSSWPVGQVQTSEEIFFDFKPLLNIGRGPWPKNNTWLEAASIIGAVTVFTSEIYITILTSISVCPLNHVPWKILPTKMVLIVNPVIIFLHYLNIFVSKIETSYPIVIYDPWIEWSSCGLLCLST